MKKGESRDIWRRKDAFIRLIYKKQHSTAQKCKRKSGKLKLGSKRENTKAEAEDLKKVKEDIKKIRQEKPEK